jgi:hypothetical protein
MNGASSAPDERPAGEQVAPGGADQIPDLPGPQARAHPGAQPGLPEAAVARAGQGNGQAAGASPTSLLEGDELQRTVIRWKEIQAQFVDEPRTAVEQADALVAGLMQQLIATLSRERAELEQRWADGSEVSTEELRQSLRRYRSFFQRLLAA